MRNLIIYILAFVAIGSALGSCSRDSSIADRLLARCDSLTEECRSSQRQLDSLTFFFDEVSSCIDSVAIEEEMLFVTTDPETGLQLTRGQINDRINQFKQLLDRQQRRIAELSSRLNNRGDTVKSNSKLNSIIDMLKRQLDNKETQLANLQTQLASSRASISQLMSKVSKLESKNSAMGEALMTQSEVINTCYVKIASKKQLKASGILEGGGFLRKAKVNPSAITTAGCSAVDIRSFTHVEFSAKKAKILSSMPSGSYRLTETDKGNWTLDVLNPTAFWSVSNVLIIQTD